MVSSEWNKYLANGVQVTPSEEVPIRQDFRDLTKEQKFLYLEGLKEFHHVKTDDPLSYYQIAGIHGLPYQTWPKEDWNTDIPGGGGGFCTHSSILFLTWHRPYLALFESTLFKHVQNVANRIDPKHADKQKYMDLAKKFRMPFWDWARKTTQIFPREALDKNYRVTGPPLLNQEKVSWNRDYNPLYAFDFEPNTPSNITNPRNRAPRPFRATVRHPGSRSPDTDLQSMLLDFYQNPDDLPVPQTWDGKPIFLPENNLTERTAWILQAYKTFPAMSNNALRQGKTADTYGDRTNWGSLEDIHNAVHGLVGNGGHMNFPEVSAFDPIFWLHHTNIDRLYDIWQALHEDDKKRETFVLPRAAGDRNWTSTPKKEETIDSPLYPFRSAAVDKDWYKSKTIRSTKEFGYTYLETKGLSYPTTEADQKKVLKLVGEMYDSLPRFIQQSKRRVPTAGQDLLPRAHIAAQIDSGIAPAAVASMSALTETLPDSQRLLNISLEPKKPLLRDLAPDNKYLEWMTNIKAEKHTLGGAYSVHVFLGPPDDESNAALWPAAPTHVGTFAPFGQSATTDCGKCQTDQLDHLQITGQIPLTIALVERYLAGVVSGLQVEDVRAYLTKELHWRVVKADGNIVNNQSEIDGLEISVVSNEVTLPENEDDLPIYAPTVTVYPEITTNRQGGGRGNGTGLAVG